MAKYKLGIVVGSNRRDSLNRKLAEALAKLSADKFDSKFLKIDDLPLYNQDDEADLPKSVARLKAEIVACDGILFVTPEYNRSIPPVLKNALDWAGRPYGKGAWTGKPAAITGSSPGAIGAGIAQQHLRQVLGSGLAMHVMGGEAYISFKPDLLDASGSLTDSTTEGFLAAYMDQFATLVGRFAQTRQAAAA
jgi:chromate reductase, NAD(P)H dehydrogenase (quinone)